MRGNSQKGKEFGRYRDVTRRWLRILRSGACTGILVSFCIAHANQVQAEETSYSIPVMPLGEALKEFGKQAGTSIVFADQSLPADVSLGLEGRYETDEALEILLANTGLGYERVDDKTLVVREISAQADTDIDAGNNSAPATSSPQPEKESNNRRARDEIVVTAQKRNQRLLDVPISISVFDSTTLGRISPQRLNDLQYNIPNVISVVSFDHTAGSYSIRGISGGTSGNIGRESASSVSVDGVYLGRSAAFNQDLVEVERIEVLRGPQGTLQGKNTMSGAINIISKKPDDEFQGRVQITGGNLGLVRGNASISGPLTDGNLFGKATVFGIRNNGYVDNVNNGQDLNDEGAVGGRIHLRYASQENLEINLTADHMRERRARYNFEPLTSNVPFVTVAPGRDTVNFDLPIDVDRDVGGVALSIDYTFDNGMSLSSISSWRYLSRFVRSDADATPFDSIISVVDEEQDQFTQELRLSTGKRGFYDVVMGLYYFYQDVKGFNTNETRPEFIFGPIGSLIQEGSVETNSYAAFAHAIFDLGERVKLDAGVRYTYEDKDFIFDQIPVPLFPFPAITGFTDSQSEGAFAPTAGLTFSVTDDVNIYAKYARGFKSGGFNFAAVTNEQLSYDAEFVDSFEIGLKSQLLDNRLSINVAGFYMDYTDQQVTLLLGVGGSDGTVIANAASSESFGFELEISAQPIPNLDVRAGFGYTDATFDEFFNGVSDFSGNRLQQAPKFNSNISATYTAELGNYGFLEFHGEHAYQDDYFLDPSNATLLPSRHIVNGRVGFVSPEREWSIYIWSRNLLDERVPENFGGDSLGFVLGSAFNAPRTFGAELNYSF